MRARDLDVPPGAGAEYGLSSGVVGIVHVRDTTWLRRPFPEQEVPPAVAQTFARGGRNFQRTHDVEAERITAEIWRRERADR